jgi:hypothetical protein
MFRFGACLCSLYALLAFASAGASGRDGREVLSGGVKLSDAQKRVPAGAIGCPADVETERTTAM